MQIKEKLRKFNFMSKIKLIVFDAYGVNLNGGYGDICAYFAKKFHRDPKELYDILYTKYFNLAAEKKISQQAAWELSIKELRLPITARFLKQKHYSLMRLNKKVLSLAKELKKYHHILLLSKNTRGQLADINRHFPELKLVYGKNIVNTWEYDLPKASPATVRMVLKRYNAKPEQTVFIDDQEQNLTAARALGVHTILYKTFTQFKKELNSFL